MPGANECASKNPFGHFNLLPWPRWNTARIPEHFFCGCRSCMIVKCSEPITLIWEREFDEIVGTVRQKMPWPLSITNRSYRPIFSKDEYSENRRDSRDTRKSKKLNWPWKKSRSDQLFRNQHEMLIVSSLPLSYDGLMIHVSVVYIPIKCADAHARAHVHTLIRFSQQWCNASKKWK
jgi:hypothetical protein